MKLTKKDLKEVKERVIFALRVGANLHETIDARVWAKEFVRINGGDEELMVGWFANAIMAGHDHGKGPINGDHAQFLMDEEAKNG